MDKLSEPMKQIIRNYSTGSVATVNADGGPAVSPKATFVVVDDCCIAYGNIRSPETSSNLRERPRIEVCFVDVLARLAVRVSGTAQSVARDSEQGRLIEPAFEESWAPYLGAMSEFVSISIVNAELIVSPAYDVGLSREELVEINLQKLENIASG